MQNCARATNVFMMLAFPQKAILWSFGVNIDDWSDRLHVIVDPSMQYIALDRR
jgi:hypothetical protein